MNDLGSSGVPKQTTWAVAGKKGAQATVTISAITAACAQRLCLSHIFNFVSNRLGQDLGLEPRSGSVCVSI